MATTLSGPMFASAKGKHARSIFGKEGGHYNISSIYDPDTGFAMLMEWFPEGEADELNFVLFSTSGVHGSYTTLEEVETDLRRGADEHGDKPIDEVIILVVCPRVVGMYYGHCRVTLDNIEYLKKLRASSWAAVQEIGA